MSSPVDDRNEAHAADSAPAGLVALGAMSLLVGAASGLIGATFRLTLSRADEMRDALITRAHDWRLAGLLLLVAVCSCATAIAAWLVRRFSPQASGSGIPHVEAVLEGHLPPATFRLLPVKFAGGVLAIGAGLALGREGPSVQMGASVSHLLGKLFRRDARDCRTLLAAGAGAGLATAFNAPIAGAVFVLEELVRRFDTRITLATFGASAGAIAVARVLLGQSPDFHIGDIPYPGFGSLPWYIALGIFTGVLGIAYNRTILGTLALADQCARVPVEARAAIVGAVVGVVAWFTP
ncbi:MAG: chloride channel protein, partial [Tepidisphaeraceae bacterium]